MKWRMVPICELMCLASSLLGFEILAVCSFTLWQLVPLQREVGKHTRLFYADLVRGWSIAWVTTTSTNTELSNDRAAWLRPASHCQHLGWTCPEAYASLYWLYIIILCFRLHFWWPKRATAQPLQVQCQNLWSCELQILPFEHGKNVNSTVTVMLGGQRLPSWPVPAHRGVARG